MNEKRKQFLGMKSVLGEDTGKMVEMTTEDLEQDINLVDKAAAGFESTDYNFKKISTVGQILSSALHATEKSFMKGRVNQYSKLLSYFKKLSQPP